jgi:hypothetical protein
MPVLFNDGDALAVGLAMGDQGRVRPWSLPLP